MIAIPLAGTRVDWGTYTSVMKDVVGRDPVRELDKQGVSLEDPAALIGSIDLDLPDTLLKHCTISFMLVVDSESAIVLYDSDLQLTPIKAKRGYLFIATGTPLQWRSTIYSFCKKESDSVLRKLFNKVCDHLLKTEFRKIFKRRKVLDDKTYYF